uniref:Uncharacterized protein n=1 Tax=Amphilophus citrinellus TaxID=61819 RepID=A0A3Q0QUW8_AMPCI
MVTLVWLPPLCASPLSVCSQCYSHEMNVLFTCCCSPIGTTAGTMNMRHAEPMLCANADPMLRQHYANADPTLCQCCANAVPTLIQRCANTMPTLIQHCTNAVPTLCQR